jgi:hypothetical protein
VDKTSREAKIPQTEMQTMFLTTAAQFTARTLIRYPGSPLLGQAWSKSIPMEASIQMMIMVFSAKMTEG